MKTDLIDKFAILITTAFGLVAALAWNEAIKSAIKQFGLDIYGPWVYAIIVTIFAVMITFWIGKISQKAKDFELRKCKKYVSINHYKKYKKYASVNHYKSYLSRKRTKTKKVFGAQKSKTFLVKVRIKSGLTSKEKVLSIV